jgi:hypothetical protein
VNGRKKLVQKCTTRLLSGTVTVKTGAAVRLLSHGHLAARGTVFRRTIVFEAVAGRTLRPGRYTMVTGRARRSVVLLRR